MTPEQIADRTIPLGIAVRKDMENYKAEAAMLAALLATGSMMAFVSLLRWVGV